MNQTELYRIINGIVWVRVDELRADRDRDKVIQEERVDEARIMFSKIYNQLYEALLNK